MIKETPDYVVFNGSIGSLSKERALKAKVGETVRIFFGDTGRNTTSSFHVMTGQLSGGRGIRAVFLHNE